jgi:PAS domain S-box-containing protein
VAAGELHAHESQAYRRDGSVIWIRSNVRAVRSAQGEVLYYEGSVEDITEQKHLHETLRESSEFNQEIINGAHEGIIVTDRSLHCLVWNPFMEQISGLPAMTVLGHPLSKILPDWQAQGLDNLIAQALDGETRASRDLPYTFAAAQHNGWMWVKIGPMRDIEDTVIGAIVMVYDITERKRNEEKLRESESKYRDLVETAHDLIWAVDTQGQITFINQASKKIYGYEPEELIGRAYLDFLPPEDRVRQLEIFRETLASGERRVLGVESEVLDREGKRHTLIANAVILYDEQGNPIGILGTSSDITERKRMEEALRESEAKFRRLLSVAPDAIVVVDTAGRIVLANHQAEILFGYASSEFYGQPIELLVPDRFRQPHIEHRMAYIAEPRVMSTAGRDGLFGLRKDGSEFPVEISVSPLQSDGAGQLIISIIHDITERKRAEEAERDQRVLAEALRDTAMALNSTLDFDQVLDQILENVGRVVPLDSVEVLLREGDGFRVVRWTGYQVHAQQVDILRAHLRLNDFTNLRKMVETKQPELIVDVREYPGWVDLPDFRWIRSHLGAPILIDDQVAGVINLNAAQLGLYTVRHMERLQVFADQAAIALKNAQLLIEAQARADELRQSQEQLRAVSARAESVREEDRIKIAREIHDDLGQSLTGLKMDLAWLTKRLPANKTQAGLLVKLQDMSDLIDQLIQAVRRIATELRPGVLDDLGLIAAIEWQADDFQRRTGLVCKVVSNVTDSALNKDQATAVFRIVQETLTNVARHAQATSIKINLKEIDRVFTVEVRDNGRGLPAEAIVDPKSLGLAGMRERALSVGGQLSIVGLAEGGTLVRLVMLLDQS